MMLQKNFRKPIKETGTKENVSFSRFARNISTALQQICDRKSPNGYGRSINTLIYSEHVMTCFNFLIVTAQEPDSICL